MLKRGALIDTSMPSQLFQNTIIPACLWFVPRDRKNLKGIEYEI